MSDEQIEAFLAEPIVAVISTVDREGRPRAAPIWFHWEDGAAYLFTGRGTLKWRNLLRRPYASLCVDKREPPYSSVILDGPVEEVEASERPLYDVVLKMAVAYYGEERGRPFAEQYRDAPGAVLFRLTPRRVASFAAEGY